MGRSGRRQGFAVATAVIVGLVTVVAIAAASRAATPTRINVSSPIPGEGTSTSTSDVNATATTAGVDTTTMQTSTTTTLPVGSSSTSEPTVDAPPLHGTYFGVEHFALYTGRCAFLDHHIVGTFSSSDATKWDFHQDYCGTLQGDLWSGVGTFALTAPDGAIITGTVTERNIELPSPGVPYTLDITGGTQRFADATGTCRLDNHLRQIKLGLQDDYGSFTCNIAV